MSQVIIAGDTSGTITLQAPAVSGSTTLTLPAATGTVMVSGNMPAFYVTIGTNQSLSSGTVTKLQFNTETFDTNSNFDSTTNYRFTPTVAGYYQINLSQEFSNTTGTQAVQIQRNGSRIASGGSPNTATNGTFMSACSVLCLLNGSTDYVEAYGYLSVGGTAFNGSSSQFSGCLVRAS